MKKISLQWRITLMTAILIGITCVSMNSLIGYSGRHYMDSIGSGISANSDSYKGEQEFFDPESADLDQEVTIIVNGAQESFSTTNWCITAVVTLLGGVLACFVSGRALKPLHTFASRVENVQPNNLPDMKITDDVPAEFKQFSISFNQMLDDKERIQWFASKYANAKDVFFIGRGIDYAISLEGSLKMKEISYIHSEAYAAGELKHGTISLIEDGILVVGVLTQNDLFEKTLSNMVEVKSRGAYLMGLTTYGNYSVEDTADFSVYVPKTEEYFSASLAIVPLQLMGYYVSVAKGLDVDKPRNLAKSVTVE